MNRLNKKKMHDEKRKLVWYLKDKLKFKHGKPEYDTFSYLIMRDNNTPTFIKKVRKLITGRAL